MPARPPSTRRRSRERNPVPPVGRSTLVNFQKPNLPQLKGTPSSRRQYSYGAGVEPLPARPGRQVDLTEAVRGAITRHEDEPLDDVEERDEQDGESSRQQESRPSSYLRGDEQDELAESEADYRPGRMSSQPSKPAPAWSPDESEVDDARSFIMENDYYGDATIDSPPRHGAGKDSRRRHSAPDNDFDDVTAAAPVNRSSRTSVSPEADPIGDDEDRQQVDATPKRLTRRSVQRLLNEKRKNVAPASPPESEAPTARQFNKDKSTQQAADDADANDNQPLNTRRWLIISPRDSGTGLFPRTAGRDSRHRSDHSEMDAAVQQDIQDTETEDTRRRRRRRAQDRQDTWWQRWAGVTSFRPRRREARQPSEQPINWWPFLDPATHLRAFLCFLRSIMDKFASALSRVLSVRVQRHLTLCTVSIIYLVAGILVALFAISLSGKAVNVVRGDISDHLLAPMIADASWPFQAIASKIGGFIPSWSSGSWDDFPVLANLSEHERAKIEDWLDKIMRELRILKDAGKLHDASIKKLESIVPKLVHMNLKDGKPVVAQEFWHAIRDLIHQDGSFLTLEKKGNIYEVSTQWQWKAIAAQLAKDPAFTLQLNSSLVNMEYRLMDKMPHYWDTWVTNNQRKISQMFGSSHDKAKPSGSQQDFDERLEEMVKKHLATSEADGVVVTREQFLRHLKNEFATHRAEIKAEISELQPKLEQLVRESLELANNDVPSGMTRAEIEQLVNGLVRKAIADTNLEAMAKGRIHAHWDQDLKNRVNYFGIGAGAMHDPTISSKSFKPDQAYLEEKGLSALLPNEPIVALMPWHDDGDCWCAARTINKRGNPHGVFLSVLLGHYIIPQHVVVEHILPGATTDPGARPRDIEVYASIDDMVTRGRTRDFAAAHFPDDKEDWNHTPPELPERFVKIGQFVYEGAELHNGVHVHSLSSELMSLGAETDQVLIRAVSNYGAANHTCFYRVRLYGHGVDQPGTE